MTFISDYLENKNTNHHLPGGLPIWIFIFSEMTEFALFFIVFLIVKYYFPDDFHHGPRQLNINFAIANTLFLITSSYLAAKSVGFLRQGQQRKAIFLLSATILLGGFYCIVKYFEYQWNTAQGLSIQTNYFFTSYYYLTFNHLLHVWIAMAVLGITLIQTILGHYNADNYSGYEGAVSYWHMIDLVWMILFPLLYILA